MIYAKYEAENIFTSNSVKGFQSFNLDRNVYYQMAYRSVTRLCVLYIRCPAAIAKKSLAIAINILYLSCRGKNKLSICEHLLE